jgi:hypothetical protein
VPIFLPEVQVDIYDKVSSSGGDITDGSIVIEQILSIFLLPDSFDGH